MMRKLLLLLFLVTLTIPALAQDITFDGHNCKPGGGSEWGIPDFADGDIDGDGFGDRDTPTGTADVLNLWYRQYPEYFLLAFERRKTGNSYFAIYLNTDCDTSTGDQTRNGADISLAFDISPGITPEITNNLIYDWNGSEYVSTGKTFEAKVGMESCDGAMGNFFEFRIPVADIFEVCGNENACHNITLNQASSLAGGSPNSKAKDVFDFAMGFGINSDPTAHIEAPDDVCAGREFTLDGSASTAFDTDLYTEANAPDFMDNIVSWEWDLNYNGNSFQADITGASPTVSLDKTGKHIIALKVTDTHGCSDIITHKVMVNSSPVAHFDYSTTDDCGLQFAFDASDSRSSSNKRCIREFEWDFNYDGSFETDATGIYTEWSFEKCGTYTVALRITDNSKSCNTDIMVKTIEVIDTEAPEFTVPADIEIDVDADPQNLSITGDVTDASDNCQVASVSFEDKTETDECGVSVIERTWTVTDGCGNETSKTQTITTPQDEEAPSFTEELPEISLEVSCDAIPEAETLTATDNYTTDITVDLEETISGMDDGCTSEYTITRTWSAKDCAGNIVSHTQTITVTDTDAPSFNEEELPANTTASCESIPEAVILTASDNCDNVVEVQFEEVVENTDECGTTGTITRTWTATDCAGNSTTHRQIITVTDDAAPAFNEQMPENTTVSCDEMPEVPVITATDNCDTSVDVEYEEKIRETNDCGMPTKIHRIWTATDCAGNEVSHCQVITITDTDAPVFNETLPVNITVGCSEIPEAPVLTANDNCDTSVDVEYEEKIRETNDCGMPTKIHRIWTATDCAGNEVSHCQVITIIDTDAPVFNETLPEDTTITCSTAEAPAILTATDACAGAVKVDFKEEVTSTNSCGGASEIIRTWTATDCSGNTASHTQIITIADDTAPVFNESLPENTTISCGGSSVIPVLTATDACDGTVEVSYEEMVNATDACGNIAEIVRTWTATDCSGNTATHTQMVTITDNEAPSFGGDLPGDMTLSCGEEIPVPATLTATDNCDATVSVEMSEETVMGSCAGEQQIIRTWTATDCAGNTAIHTQVITVEDNEAPILVSDLDAEISVTCGDIPEVPELRFEDACGGTVNVTFESTDDFTSPMEDYMITRAWTVSDACGNTATFTQDIFVMMESEKITLEPITLCVEDASVNLNDLLPANAQGTGSWNTQWGNHTVSNGIFDPFESLTGNFVFNYISSDGTCPVVYEIGINVHDDCVVLPCSSKDDIVISKAVTPNGDGYNDYFTVTGLNENCGFRITVKIFNRWEQLVYKSDNYQNNWSGIASANAVGGSGQLPSGTYYYIVTLVDSGLEPFTGYIYLGTGS